MSIKTLVPFILFAALVPLFARGATLHVKGMATVSTSGRGASAKEIASATQTAKINAVERYVAGTNEAEQRNYDLIKGKIAADIDDYVLSSSVVEQNTDKQAKTFTIVLDCDLNISELDNALRSNSAESNTSQSNRSYITFIFVARKQQTIQSFAKEVTNKNSSNVSENGMDMEASSGGKKGYASETNKNITTITGGSVIQRAAKVTYAVTSSDAVNDVISNELSQAGYQVVDAAFIQQLSGGKLSIDSFKKDFTQGNDISASTLMSATLGAQQAKVPYLAYGTLDVGFPGLDSATGLTRVYVTVTAKIYNLTSRFPVTVASIGPEQYAGLGPDADVARTNALKQAADAAARKLVSELDAKGIQ